MSIFDKTNRQAFVRDNILYLGSQKVCDLNEKPLKMVIESFNDSNISATQNEKICMSWAVLSWSKNLLGFS